MQMVFDAAHVTVGNGPNNTKILQITDANNSALVVILPLNADAAKTIGLALQSQVLIAGGPLFNKAGADR